MQSLDLVNHQGPIKFAISSLKPEELFYVRVTTLNDIPMEQLALIIKASMITNHVIVSIPAEDFTNNEMREKLFKLGVKGFAIRVKHQVEKYLKVVGQGQFHSGDKEIRDQYDHYRRLINQDQLLIPEFQVGEDTRVLGGTITGLYELGARFIVMNPEGTPTPARCAQFRDLFEFLKMRSTTRLNLYFPFWKTEFREWDIKTQNIFSGLEQVHIDISNRCTHSCVFCGLYGPDAIEDMKKRSGGKISDEINKFMKMEIDSEKCFSIIRSLPWSVRSIQFGGFGDPLMHENAVNFIAEARKRGFSVEMLSNMEYLDENDIHKLHRLGGRSLFDMHFIANISAGNPELYIKTRPKQTAVHYQKIINNLSLFSKLRNENNGNGVHFTLMCVVNKYNCQDLEEVSQLALKIGASRIWFKPMEIHGPVHEMLIPAKDMMKGMAKSLADAIKTAEAGGITVFQKDYCDEIIRKYSGDTINV